MIKRLLQIFLLSAAIALPVTAQTVATLTGRATYYGDDSDSPATAKNKALEMARIDALAREFGTVLSQTNVQRNEVSNGQENNFFSSLSASEVKGEWIADDGEPKFTVELDGDYHYVVTCTVKIKARALSNKAADFHALVLRNGTSDRFADTQFNNGDQIYLKFISPADGYIAAYLVCGDEVLTLLPYLSSASGKVKVRHNKQYVFFSGADADIAYGTPDEYLLQTDQPRELNQLYLLFSPNEFTKALDTGNGDAMPRSQSYADFVKWLAKTRRADDEMGMKVFNIEITKK